jgi:hypothetical protein
VTSERDRERWRKRTAIILRPNGELGEVPPTHVPPVGFPKVDDFPRIIGGGRYFIPSYKWFHCVACCFCELHVRRENLRDHLRRHDETNDRKLIRDEYKVGSHHRVLQGQQKLMV